MNQTYCQQTYYQNVTTNFVAPSSRELLSNAYAYRRLMNNVVTTTKVGAYGVGPYSVKQFSGR